MIPFFSASCLVQAPYLVKFTSHNLKVPVPLLCLYFYLQQHKAQPNEKGSSFKALSTDLVSLKSEFAIDPRI